MHQTNKGSFRSILMKLGCSNLTVLLLLKSFSKKETEKPQISVKYSEAHAAVLPYLLPLPLILKFRGREVWKIGVVVVERNCVRRPTLFASPTTKTSQPPLQKMRARPPKRASSLPPLQKMRALGS